MPIGRRGFLASCLGAGAFALTGCDIGALVHRERWYLFGTLLDVTLPVGDTGKQRPALAALSARLQAAHHDWHAWKPGQLLTLNQAIARGESAPVSEDLARLLLGTRRLHVATGGAFNPAIGGVLDLWGFHADELPHGAPPRAKQIERLLADQPRPQDLVYENGRLASRNPRVQLDLGGYGKGYALQQGMELLREHDLTDGVVNAGGDLCVMGSKAGAPWRIAVRHPQGRGVLGWLETDKSEGIFTSGNYERYRSDGSKRYAHILDPRSGQPVEQVVSATVVHPDGGLADAAATALMVAGPDRWHDIAAALGVQQAMVVDRDGRVQVTRALFERLHLDGAVLRRALIV
jgi:thiamine biosynthesis lipoprotein